MAETAAEPTQAQPAQAEPAQQAAQPVAQKVDIVGQALDDLGSFMTPEDRAALIKLYEEKPDASAPAKPAEDKKPNDTKDTPAATDTAKKADEKPEGATADTKPAEEKKGIFGLGKKKADGKPDLIIEKPEQILEVIKSKYGQDLKEIKELPKFFESVDKMRADAQKLKAVEEKHDSLWKELESLPADLVESMKAFQRGEDYTAAFTQKAPVDFSKPFDKQDSKALVNHYFPGKFTEDDFKESQEDKADTLKIAEEAIKIKFEAEKQTHDFKRATVSDNAKKVLEAQKAAASSSVSNLKQRFPDIDDDAFSKVKSVVEGGPQKVLSFFFNNDGTIKPDAATRLTAAMNYDELINEAAGLAAHAAETKINEDLLSRGADAPAAARPAANIEKIDAETKEKIDEMTRLGALSSKRTF